MVVNQNELKQFPDRDGNLGTEVKDFIKFRIRDAVNGKYIIFPALISGITDNSSAQYHHLVILVVQIKFTFMVDMKEVFHFTVQYCITKRRRYTDYLGKDKLRKRISITTI